MLEKAPKYNFGKIFKLPKEEEILDIVNEINEEYLYWDKVKYKTKNLLKPEELWDFVKTNRYLTSSPINFGNYSFRFSTTPYVQKTLHSLDINIGGHLGSQNIIPERDKNRYLISSIMEEAISSSKIEGASTTRKKAKEMLRKEIKPKNKSDQMIVNNFYTINYITKNKLDNLTLENLLLIHQLITKETLDNRHDEGHFRDDNEIVVGDGLTGETVHTPPDFKEIKPLMNELCKFFNTDDDSVFIHPILKGIIIHFMIGWIHPFVDGNGRTARSLFYWYLLKKGYSLTEYLSISRIIQHSKVQYEKAYLYTENDENDLTYFIVYNLNVMEKAFKALKTYLAKKQQESQNINQYLRIPNINERQAVILEIVTEEPNTVFNVKEIENRFAISNYTARTDLKNLVDLGFLEVIAVNKKKNIFVKSLNFENLTKKYR